MGFADRYADVLTTYSRVVLVLLLVSTVAVGYGAGSIDSGLTIASFGSDSTEAQKLDYVQSNFTAGEQNTSVVQVVVRGDNVLTKESLLETLRLQQRLRENATVNRTLREGQSTVGLSNLVATAAIRQERSGNRTNASAGPAGGPGAPPARSPTLDAQIDQLESMSQSEIDRVVVGVLDPDRTAGGPVDPFTLLATDYEPGTTTASARVVFVFQQADTSGDSLPEEVVSAQLATQDIADRTVKSTDAFAFGAGIVSEESGQATGESFAVITPFALLLVVGVLLIAYRDLLDVALGLAGTLLVLVWMGGFMGWAGIGVTQIIIAVPFLLIGLSIDYALHVVMRYREARTADADRSVRETMRAGLSGVTVALAATTFTTAVGFTSNLVSPIESIRQFGLVSAFGIVSAFVVFAGLLPALKLELEALLERFGFDRRKRAFGTGGSAANRLLGVGATAARKIPVAVVLVALVASAGGGYAATDIDTSINQVDFLPRDSPDWMDSLPGPLRPGDYDLRENVVYLNDKFVQSRDRSEVQILVEGPVTAPDTLDRLAAGGEAVAESSTAITLASGRPSVDGPVSVIRRVSARNETVRQVVAERDTDGDGIPDRDLRAVYDALYAAAPDEAAGVVYRADDGEYRALRLSVAIRGGSNTGAVTEEMRAVAETIEDDSDLTVTATGQPIINEIVQQGLLTTLVQTFLITLGVIVAFLTVIFYRRYGTLSLGAVTMVPVVFALSWILGAMYLLGIPFNTETAIIASIAIGIGVDYAIHISERFVEELSNAGTATAALETTLAGTGGALLASAVTTAGGFGVLLFALVPSLQRFGLVTGTTIVFAFLSSVVVLPSLLVLWWRYLGTGTPVGDAPVDTAGD
ncbi:efflux RND transporter permease subunit [Halorussus lipolyticus]|uniref:efflux RND transporter permease subunit n=1 Tax=Halorussus lipolyticus TaxID=3034024 RepID=UPI0023E842D7|nr:MMPL family transporter [Halorussus sp. DT80]